MKTQSQFCCTSQGHSLVEKCLSPSYIVTMFGSSKENTKLVLLYKSNQTNKYISISAYPLLIKLKHKNFTAEKGKAK